MIVMMKRKKINKKWNSLNQSSDNLMDDVKTIFLVWKRVVSWLHLDNLIPVKILNCDGVDVGVCFWEKFKESCEI